MQACERVMRTVERNHLRRRIKAHSSLKNSGRHSHAEHNHRFVCQLRTIFTASQRQASRRFLLSNHHHCGIPAGSGGSGYIDIGPEHSTAAAFGECSTAAASGESKAAAAVTAAASGEVKAAAAVTAAASGEPAAASGEPAAASEPHKSGISQHHTSMSCRQSVQHQKQGGCGVHGHLPTFSSSNSTR